jgi:hypothetical protein
MPHAGLQPFLIGQQVKGERDIRLSNEGWRTMNRSTDSCAHVQ